MFSLFKGTYLLGACWGVTMMSRLGVVGNGFDHWLPTPADHFAIASSNRNRQRPGTATFVPLSVSVFDECFVGSITYLDACG
jgi:hypothetical protein